MFRQPLKLMALMVCFLLFFSSCSEIEEAGSALNPNFKKEIPKEGVKVYFIELTNGEATLIKLENGEHILIDTGSHSSKTELFSFLREHQVQAIEHLLITNEKDEHFGNFAELYEEFQLHHIYFPYHLKEELFQDRELIQLKLDPLKAGDTIQFHRSKIKVIHPGKELSLSPQDNSLVFQFKHEKNIFFFTSDISDQAEKKLVSSYNLKSHVLKVSDFGSNQASSPEFLAEVDAHVAIIFHRPDFYLDHEVVERLEESWMDVYPLKKHGHLLVVSQKEDYELFVLSSKKDFDRD